MIHPAFKTLLKNKNCSKSDLQKVIDEQKLDLKDQLDDEENSLLMLGLEKKNDNFVQAILELDTSNSLLTLQNEDEESPLFYAISGHQTIAAKAIIRKIIDANLQKTISLGDINSAIFSGQSEIANILVEAVIKAGTLDSNKALALLKTTAEFEQIDIIRNLVKEKLIQPSDLAGFVEIAFEYNKPKLLDFLLNEGFVDFTYKSKRGESLLDLAVDYDRPDLIQKLHEAGFSKKEFEKSYSIAFIRNATASLKKLIELKADPNFRDRNGMTAIHLAAKNKDAGILKDLVSLNGDIKLQTREGKTPLHYAIENDNYKSAEFLVNQGSPINLTDKYGNTALHVAAHQQSDQFLKLLLETKQHDLLHKKNNLNQTPLEAAADRGSIECFNTLISYYSVENEKLVSICEIAAKQGHAKFIEAISEQYNLKLDPNSLAYRLIHHENKEYIEKISNQFNQEFGKINSKGGIASFARIKEAREKQQVPFDAVVLERDRDFRRVLNSALERVRYLPDKTLSVRLAIANPHWTYCDIKIDNEQVDICFIDSLGHGGAIENYLPMIFEIAPNAHVSEVTDKRQNSERGCSVMVIDDAEHASVAEKRLPPEYQETGLHGYVNANPHPKGMITYTDDSNEQKTYNVHQVYLPLYLSRTTQSVSLKADLKSDQETPYKNISWFARAKKEELEHPITKSGKLPHESVGEYIYEQNDVRSNQRLEHKMRRMCSKNIEFMLNHDTNSLEKSFQEVTADGFIEKTEQLKKLASQDTPSAKL